MTTICRTNGFSHSIYLTICVRNMTHFIHLVFLNLFLAVTASSNFHKTAQVSNKTSSFRFAGQKHGLPHRRRDVVRRLESQRDSAGRRQEAGNASTCCS